jgi:hypothetical protein
MVTQHPLGFQKRPIFAGFSASRGIDAVVKRQKGNVVLILSQRRTFQRPGQRRNFMILRAWRSLREA